MHTLTTKWFLFGLGAVVGVVSILGIRFITYQPEAVHYHANFALYINGQQELFKGSQYYEEETMCSVNTAITPRERAHMHDNINNVVHVEDHAVTWGQFFANLGWTLGPNFIGNPDGTVYVEKDADKLNFILNGQRYGAFDDVQNTVIKDRDILLISFGAVDSSALQQEYRTIPSTARHYDETPDPKTCSGSDHTISVQDRLMHLF